MTNNCQAWGRRGYRLIGLAALLAAAILGLSAPIASAETITVEGNRRIDAETVRTYFKPGPDGRYDTAARDAALKALIATGLFDNVSIEHAGDHLIVHLTEA